MWIADPALEEAGALLGLARADPPRAVVCTATAALLIRAWGVQATTIADVEVFMRLLEACRAAAATAPMVTRIDGGAAVLLSAEDLLTIASALDAYRRPPDLREHRRRERRSAI